MSVVALISAGLLLQVPVEDRPITAEAIARAAEQLGDSSFAVRQEATELLWRAGPAAEATLREAVKSNDPEVRTRARSVLDKLRFGIRPDTPADVLVVIDQFRFGSSMAARRQALSELQSKGQWPVILALLRGEESDERRKSLAALVAAESSKLVGPLIEQGRFDEAAEVLDLTGDTLTGQPQLAAFLLLTNQLDARIAKLQARTSAAPRPTDWQQLALLLHAKGEDEAAAEAASQGDDKLLYVHLLAAAGRWAEAATAMEALYQESPQLLDRAAFAATFFRLAGDRAGYERLIEVLRAAASVEKTETGFALPEIVDAGNAAKSWFLSETLLINEEPERALPLLRRTHPQHAHAILWRQHRHAEALKFVNIADDTALDRAWLDSLPAAPGDPKAQLAARFSLAAQAARQLHELGRTEQQGQIVETLRTLAATDSDSGRRWTALAALHWQLGRFDEAFADAHQAIAARQPTTTVFNSFLKQQGQLAAIWYEFLISQDPLADREKLIATSVWLVVAQPPRGRLPADWRKALEQAIAAGDKLEDRLKHQRLVTIGETYLVRDDAAKARECFEAAAGENPQAALKAGDLALKDERWTEAAAWYAKAAGAGSELVAAYLEGYAQAKAGEAVQGEEQQQRASLLALSPDARGVLATGLLERGLRPEAAEQFEIVRRTVSPALGQSTQAAQQVGNLVSKDEPARAAACWRQLLLQVLNRTTNFTEAEGYLTLPHVIHKTLARAALAKDQYDEAAGELAACQALLPGDVRLIVELVPQLDKAGQQATADKLFGEAFEAHHAVCEAFPTSATYLNNTAWLAARSQRRLDEALVLVQRAIELVPDEPAYQDTLAEVHFQRGDREAAVAAAKRGVELSPDSALFKSRLAHFENDEVKTLDGASE